MTEPEDLQPDDRAFEDWLRDSMDSLRQEKGACPDANLLAKHACDGLSGEEAVSVADHVAACGLCECAVENLRRSEEAWDQAGQAPAPPAWNGVDRRLTDDLQRFLNSVGGREAGASKQQGSAPAPLLLSFLIRHPVLAHVGVGCFLLLAGFCLYLAFFRQTPAATVAGLTERVAPSPPASAGIQPARIFDLSETRGAESGEKKVTLSRRENLFILSFFVPARPDYRYLAMITGNSGTRILESHDLMQPDASGVFHLVCERSRFTAGDYVLTVKEFTQGADAPVRTFEFLFSFQPE
jgi:hypothetical protein